MEFESWISASSVVLVSCAPCATLNAGQQAPPVADPRLDVSNTLPFTAENSGPASVIRLGVPAVGDRRRLIRLPDVFTVDASNDSNASSLVLVSIAPSPTKSKLKVFARGLPVVKTVRSALSRGPASSTTGAIAPGVAENRAMNCIPAVTALSPGAVPMNCRNGSVVVLVRVPFWMTKAAPAVVTMVSVARSSGAAIVMTDPRASITNAGSGVVPVSVVFISASTGASAVFVPRTRANEPPKVSAAGPVTMSCPSSMTTTALPGGGAMVRAAGVGAPRWTSSCSVATAPPLSRSSSPTLIVLPAVPSAEISASAIRPSPLTDTTGPFVTRSVEPPESVTTGSVSPNPEFTISTTGPPAVSEPPPVRLTSTSPAPPMIRMRASV